MKPILFFIAFFLTTSWLSAQQEQYLLILGQDTLIIQEGNQYVYVTTDGREMPLKLIKQQIQQYASPMIQFDYLAQYQPTKAMVADGVSQLTLLTEGEQGIIVYESANGDPAQQIGPMMDEMTQEKIGYGYQYSEQTFQKILSDGKLLIGRKRTLIQGNNTETYTVAAFTGQNNGILVVTLTNNLGNPQQTTDLINMFFNTLVIR